MISSWSGRATGSVPGDRRRVRTARCRHSPSLTAVTLIISPPSAQTERRDKRLSKCFDGCQDSKNQPEAPSAQGFYKSQRYEVDFHLTFSCNKLSLEVEI